MSLRAPRPGLWIALALALLAAGVYANSLANGFALDDHAIVVENELVHGLDRLGEAVTSQYWPQSPARIGLYRPVTVAGLAIQWELWDGNPRGFHALNILLHVAVTLLVFALLLRLGAPRLAAAGGAALFAVHPVHTEAVANVVGQGELLAALFFLSACLVYLRRAWPLRMRAPLVGALYFLALGAKESAIVLPAALVLLAAADTGDADPAHRPDRLDRRLLRELPVFAAVAAAGVAYVAVRFAALGVLVGNDVAPFLETLPTGDRVASALRVWPEYLRLLFFPRDLVADYSPGVIFSVNGLEVRGLLGLVSGAAILLLGVVAWRRTRLLSIGVFWFPVTIFAVSNLLVPVGVLLAERTLYLPSVALAFGAAAVLARVPRQRPRRAAALALGAALLALAGWWTWQRNPVWRSTQTVLDDLVRHHPESFRAQWAVGEWLVRTGRHEDGFRLYREAIALAPTHYSLVAEYGLKLLRAGRPAQAEGPLRRALQLVPEHAEASLMLAQALLEQRKFTQAIGVLEAGVARHPNERGLHHQLAIARGALGEWQAALTARQTALRLAGDRASWQQWLHLAQIQQRLGDDAAAQEALARARSLAPAAEQGHVVLDHALVSVPGSP